jgi:DNA polymerase-3 subunit delta'
MTPATVSPSPLRGTSPARGRGERSRTYFRRKSKDPLRPSAPSAVKTCFNPCAARTHHTDFLCAHGSWGADILSRPLPNRPPVAYNVRMWNIIGHHQAATLLQRAIAADEVRHAYLFTGAPSIGKRTLATEFARALQCPAAQPPCGTCLTCRKISHGNHQDVLTVLPAPGKRLLGIEAVRDLQREASRPPVEARWRIFIIPNAEAMTLESANCLLKTLEEPATHTVLLLTAADTQTLLPTVVSRCQHIPLHPVSATLIRQALVAQGLAADQAAQLATLAIGQPGWALAAAQDSGLLGERLSLLDLLGNLPEMSRAQRFRVAAQFAEDPERLRDVLDLWLVWWRDVLLASEGCLDLLVTSDQRNRLRDYAGRWGSITAERSIRAVLRTIQELDQNVNPRLALEALMLDLPGAPIAQQPAPSGRPTLSSRSSKGQKPNTFPSPL